jgi:multiple sugar transport system ATP-binding protein
MTAAVSLSGVAKRFAGVEVIRGVDLEIAPGEFCVFVGPSGCGKSTLLRLVAGLEEASEGRIAIGGADVTRVAPANRGVAMVFQSYALYPHMTVAENIGFPLRMANRPRAEVAGKVDHAARLLQLGQLLKRKPAQLSGGQRQRVAIGRAIVRDPKVFLFDEPLSNLDAALRVEMRVQIGRLHQELGSTMIYVTHDQVEAMTLADRIVVLNAGRIEQQGSPLDLYLRPASLFVAGFLGSPTMNLLPAIADGGTLRLKTGETAAVGLAGRGEVTVGVRPEHLALGEGPLRGTVSLVEHLGNETLVHVDAGQPAPVVVRAGGLARIGVGERVGLAIDPAALHVFGPDGRALRNATLA